MDSVVSRGGDFRHRALIESLSKSPNAFGEPVETWSELATVWAKVEALTGSEAYAARQLIAEVEVKLTIRFRDDLTELMRATLPSGDVLDIRSVLDEDGRRRETVLLCSRRSNGQ